MTPRSMWRKVSGTWVKLWNNLTINVSGVSTSGTTTITKSRFLTAVTDTVGNSYAWSVISDSGLNAVTLTTPSLSTTQCRRTYPAAEPDTGTISIQLVVTGPDAGTYSTSFVI